ncbi:TetR/AcrR family transcriptional regulator [Massilia arenosa]|uniref:TetR/AcrR family transcriptional regulator n=1 Tax=Zemynaea arenosa TaxID=2561931 RepID=A0A4Y9S3G0_9BURK|nr:TetR/AcrR family transcriptional regulator [Massilia arenosa]TFW16038.1 TetR/AcrR family transcriptional regulator [Massilia arenosa]
MTKPRGRPPRGDGLSLPRILDTALALLGEEGGKEFSLRTLAARLGVTPMSLYHHVPDYAGLLRAVSDRVYGTVLEGVSAGAPPLDAVRAVLLRYHGAVAAYPRLALAIFTEPAAFAGVTREITGQLTAWLSVLTAEPDLWLEILVDHAHGSGLAFQNVDAETAAQLRARYAQALDRLLAGLVNTSLVG